MRKGVVVALSAPARARLERVAADRNSPQKHVWRARIVLATADGCGTAEIMRRTGKSKPLWSVSADERVGRCPFSGLVSESKQGG